MEFGIFIQGYLPGPDAHDSAAEHGMLLEEIEYVRCADANNWKYVWISEHHALAEYSHISASDVVRRLPRRGHRADPHRLGDLQPEPAGQPPRAQRRARRHARPPHEPPLRVRHRPRRGVPRGRHVQHPRHVVDEGRVGRGDLGDRPDVGAQGLHVRGQPLRARHAPQHARPSPTARGTRRCGSRAATRRPSARRASTASARSGSTSRPITEMKPASSTSTRKASPSCTNPVGAVRQRQRDDHQRGALLRGPGQGPRDRAALRRGYLFSLVLPLPRHVPQAPPAPVTWPEKPPALAGGVPRPGDRDGRGAVRQPRRGRRAAAALRGAPASTRWCSACPTDMHPDEALECIETVRQVRDPRVRP